MLTEDTVGTGKSKGFYTDVECQGKHQGVINAHSKNFQIITAEFVWRAS